MKANRYFFLVGAIVGILCVLSFVFAYKSEAENARPLIYPSGRDDIEIDLGGGAEIKLVHMPAGEFIMGSSNGYGDEGPRHKVKITEPFYMGVTEVTQRQYEAVMGVNPSEFRGADRPVDSVPWRKAAEFCERVARRTSMPVRLPTEAQWEYACRAGSDDAYCFGDDVEELADYAWYAGNSGGRSHPVAQKKPNQWGLYDMHGDVWEWCRDWYAPDYYENAPMIDPPGPKEGSNRVWRGGSWYHLPFHLRSSNRDFNKYPLCSIHDAGFRVVISVQ